MKIAIVSYPGSTSLPETVAAYQRFLKMDVIVVEHREETLRDADVVVLPGGASFGDHLRAGALAKVSPISGSIRRYAKDGKPVLGIGNGFQILCEMGVLPGALLQNESGKFIGADTWVKIESCKGPFLKSLTPGALVKLPLASRFGNYFADYRTVKDLEDNGHIALRYCDAEGEVNKDDNVNGSINSIAGIMSRSENVLGIMPHPERAVESHIGGTHGLTFLQGLL